MRRSLTTRGAGLVLGAVALVAVVGCSSDDPGTSDGGSSGSSGDTLVVKLRAEFDRDPQAVRGAADALPHVLGIDAARLTATAEGTAMDVVVSGVTDAEVDELLERMTNPPQILARPVVNCAATPSDDTSTAPAADPDATQELPTSDGAQWCVVGPTSAGGGVFQNNAEAVNDPARGWLVAVSVSSEGRAFNDVVRECFQKSTVCPSGQLAIGLGSELITVGAVNAPSLGGIEIAGLTEAEAKSIAADLRAYSVFWGFTVESSATSEG